MFRSSLSSWRSPRRPEAKGKYLGIAVIIVLLLSLPLAACGNKPVMTRPTPTATATATMRPTSTATPTPTATGPSTPTPTPLVDNYDKNFFTSHNPDLTDKGLEVFGTLSTDKRNMDLFNGGNKPINWKITSIDSQNGWLSADPLSGTAQAQPRDNFIMLTASNSQANLPPGSYKATISFKPVNPNEPKPITVPLTVHRLPTFSTLTAPVPVPTGTTITITDDGSFTDLDMIAGISFGSAKVSSSSFISQSSSEIILALPSAENPGTVPITITVNRHDGSSMSFTLPDQFTYTSTATPTTQPPTPTPTPTQLPTLGTANIHTTRGKIALAVR